MQGARISQCSKTSNLFPDELSQVESRVGTMISVKFSEAKLEIQEKKRVPLISGIQNEGQSWVLNET